MVGGRGKEGGQVLRGRSASRLPSFNDIRNEAGQLFKPYLPTCVSSSAILYTTTLVPEVLIFRPFNPLRFRNASVGR